MEKYFLKSKTVWGVIIAALPQLLPVFGIDWSAEDNTMLSTFGNQAFVAAGSALALYGRFTADTKITVK